MKTCQLQATSRDYQQYQQLTHHMVQNAPNLDQPQLSTAGYKLHAQLPKTTVFLNLDHWHTGCKCPLRREATKRIASLVEQTKT